MKNTEVTLVPLTQDDREQFITENQWAFKFGALEEFGKRDDHIDDSGEIISKETIEKCIDHEQSETYRIVANGKKQGGLILKIDKQAARGELEILFVTPDEHSKGVGFGAWQQVEKMHPEIKVWHTCTPYFEKRNIHFYINKCGFKIDEFWCEYFSPTHKPCDEHNPDEGPDEMFHFVKIME